MLCPLRKETIEVEQNQATDNNRVYTVTKWKSIERFLPCVEKECQMYDKENLVCRLRSPL